MGKAGVSITITSLTDAMAFLLGATSQLEPQSTPNPITPTLLYS